uniref:PEF-CTERM protein sorting domain-containing protein n=1 Tax=Candidatus Methanophaga sp. ANME-1 ERB7 TaxID=2759913 RepID=A0A7G9ZBH3_9EURY|nr:hypothetical protein LCMFKOLL_00003 [Methanosarcinales archaeon ANME-1 ERB7]
MNVKRIGTVLTVGLVLLSAMVVFVGTAAATSNWLIQFEGTIEGVAKGTVVNIERTVSDGSGYTYTQTWSGSTDSNGYFITGKAVFSDETYTPINDEPHYPTSAYYQLYIGVVPGEGKPIGLPYDSWENGASGEFHGPNRFTWHGHNDGTDECYYIYAWHKQEIPEFSTIAIPVASILGLLFFFNRRKHRTE